MKENLKQLQFIQSKIGQITSTTTTKSKTLIPTTSKADQKKLKFYNLIVARLNSNKS